MKKTKHIYKHSLDNTSSKYTCPQCKKKRLVKYIDNENGHYLSDNVGRCDREVNCGYHYKPKEYFIDNNLVYKPQFNREYTKTSKTASFHNDSVLKNTLNNYETNNFILFLYRRFSKVEIQKMIRTYKIGTADFWYNGTIFWQVDINNKIRGGKIISYQKNGKRTKYINWVHSYQIKKNKLTEYSLEQCLFGEHLVSKNKKPIAIVESEKTACIMSLLFDKYLWLATGSLHGLNEKRLEVIKNKKIILYPDLGVKEKNCSPFVKWSLICDELSGKGYDIKISDLLERKGTKTERENGFDIADYFLNNNAKKPIKIISKKNESILKMYMKNKNIKTLIEVFDLSNLKGEDIRFE